VVVPITSDVTAPTVPVSSALPFGVVVRAHGFDVR
jgi:hypothetical protein